MEQAHHVKNFNHAGSEAICKAVFPDVYCVRCQTPDELGNTWHVTTDALYAMAMVLGSGKSVDEAWAAAHENYREEIWSRIRGGHYTRDVTLGGEREAEPPPTLPKT